MALRTLPHRVALPPPPTTYPHRFFIPPAFPPVDLVWCYSFYLQIMKNSTVIPLRVTYDAPVLTFLFTHLFLTQSFLQ